MNHDKKQETISESVLGLYLMFLGSVVLITMTIVEQSTKILKEDIYSGFVFAVLIYCFIVYFIIILYGKNNKVIRYLFRKRI